MTKSSLKVFKGSTVRKTIEKTEKKYISQGKDISNTILLLHVLERLGYSIPADATTEETESNFKGIYFISPQHDYVWQNDKEKKLEEFVVEIKGAF